ncbi:ficolin-1-like [Drosophila sulfurigaster albostrigata]|uniref:ficolin-1-like n=1 Tax=Drosophila sulfurigaster albostrigata TaxID=89887 RepID=UPI002D21BD46|nr:ficolin-1-like [Drosophila sulfurigaster albostrigata]
MKMLNRSLLLSAIAMLTIGGVDANESEFIATSSCIPYAQSPGIHQITAPGLSSFDVLCDSTIFGSGWTIIQQRIDGKEDFYRNWANYSAGFGSLNGDFFLGLERIHRLTSAHRHELNIYMEKFNGEVENAHYDRFQVAGEEENYKLSSVGNFTKGRVFDCLNWHYSESFSTYDRDNDNFKDTNCAEQRQSGWWFAYCGLCNLNGRYFDHEVQNVTGIFWTPRTSLKAVKMLIRPVVEKNQ